MRFSQIDMGRGDDGSVDDLRAILDRPELRLLIDRMPDGIVVIDRNGTVITLNGVAAAVNEVRRPELIGRPLSTLMEQSALDWTEIADCYFARQKGECLSQTDDGRSVLTSIRQLRDERGDVALTLVVQRDLQVLDHLRRNAVGAGRRDLFKFLADREIGPDFAVQRRISAVVDRTLDQAERALIQGARILLIGESGSGKTEIAKYLHRIVGAPEEPFVHVNCGAIPESLFESEMFGYERGAFTGALQSGKKGLIEAAEGGMLFLDEVGEIPPPSQAKLLKFLEDGMVQRIGSRSGRRVKTRVISATNRNLWQMSQEGRFRRDLYYRLAVITLEVTPLRDQPELVDHLIDYFLSAVNQTRDRRLRLAPACRSRLCNYYYPGNIRELHNLMQQLSVAAGEEATAAHLPRHVGGPDEQGRIEAHSDAGNGLAKPRHGEEGDVEHEGGLTLKNQVRAFEREVIRHAIARHGSKRRAARALGVDIGTIVRKTRENGSR